MHPPDAASPCVIQSVLFEKHMHSRQYATNFMRAHNLAAFVPRVAIKQMHETENYYRYRLHDPDTLHHYYTISPIIGVYYVIGYPQ